jgi:hypothetical protein
MSIKCATILAAFERVDTDKQPIIVTFVNSEVPSAVKICIAMFPVTTPWSLQDKYHNSEKHTSSNFKQNVRPRCPFFFTQKEV